MNDMLIFDPDATQDNPPKSEQGLISLGSSGYWAALPLLLGEARLCRAIDFFRHNKSPLKLDPVKLAAEKESFIACSKSRIDKSELDEQLCAVFRTFDHGARLSIITGPPGAAKSTTAGLWMQFMRMQHPAMPVILIAQEKTALDRLYDKINFDGARAWTSDVALQRDWPREAAIIIDEAGILGTQVMADLLEKTIRSDAVKLIMIGDDKQLLPEKPGHPFRYLCNQNEIDKIVLTQSFRQKTPHLRNAVKALYNENIPEALESISFHFIAAENILNDVRDLSANTTPEKTLIVVHGETELIDQLKLVCPNYRVLCLAESQGLAVDQVIFVLAAPINRAQLLVGCSRQRYNLELVIDAGIYSDQNDFANGITPYPTNLMALDIISEDSLIQLTNTSQG